MAHYRERMGRHVNGFGAVGLKGENCPVPAEDGFLPGTYRPETHDRWCDCMYSSNRLLLARCKWKFGDTYRNPEDPTYDGKILFDPSLPWNLTGSRSRGLIEDGLTRALQWAQAQIDEGLNPGKGGGTIADVPPADLPPRQQEGGGGGGIALAAGALVVAKLLKLF